MVPRLGPLLSLAAMDPALELALRSLLTLFVVMDPVGLVPVFVSLAGGPLLAYLGISLFALRVAGGVLLFRIGVDMVYAQVRRETPEEEAEAREKEDISIFPLAIPMISGPGALASVLLLTELPFTLLLLAMVWCLPLRSRSNCVPSLCVERIWPRSPTIRSTSS